MIIRIQLCDKKNCIQLSYYCQMVFIKRRWITKYAGVTVSPLLDPHCVGHIISTDTAHKEGKVNSKEE